MNASGIGDTIIQTSFFGSNLRCMKYIATRSAFQMASPTSAMMRMFRGRKRSSATTSSTPVSNARNTQIRM